MKNIQNSDPTVPIRDVHAELIERTILRLDARLEELHAKVDRLTLRLTLVNGDYDLADSETWNEYSLDHLNPHSETEFTSSDLQARLGIGTATTFYKWAERWVDSGKVEKVGRGRWHITVPLPELRREVGK